MSLLLSRRWALASLPLLACGRAAEPSRATARSADAPPPSMEGNDPSGAPAAAGGQAQGPGVALVELFSSEGCSSCPPADQVLAELVRARQERVYALAFHVDYWDELGWPDPFASPSYTARQQERAHSLGLRGLYTPQTVIGGREECVGSDRARVRGAIERALARPAEVAVQLGSIERRGDGVRVPYTLRGNLEGARVLVAATQDGLVTQVKRGENAGRTLNHEAVVRALTAQEASGSGELKLGAIGAASAVVVWVQGPDGVVRGATRQGLVVS